MEGFRSIMSYGNVALSVFMGWMLMSRLAGMGFSQEGKNYWMLKTAPVGAGRLLLAKFLVAYLPTLALSEVYLLGVSILQGVSISAFAYSLVAVALCLAGMGGILLGFGAAGANLNWEDPRKMNAGNLGCLGMFLTVLFVPIAFGLFIGPLLLTAFFEWSELAGYLVGLIAGGSVCLAGAVLPPWLAKNRVERLGEG
jgi:ABC-2 type transport system permease protein